MRFDQMKPLAQAAYLRCLAKQATKLRDELHEVLENEIGGCLAGIAGGCGACALCDFDAAVTNINKTLNVQAACLRGEDPLHVRK